MNTLLFRAHYIGSECTSVLNPADEVLQQISVFIDPNKL